MPEHSRVNSSQACARWRRRSTRAYSVRLGSQRRRSNGAPEDTEATYLDDRNFFEPIPS